MAPHRRVGRLKRGYSLAGALTSRTCLGDHPRESVYVEPVSPPQGVLVQVRILITDGEQRSSLAAVRSLGRAGHHVTVCSHLARPLAGASRYCRGAHQVPNAAMDEDGFVAAVRDLVDSGDVDFLLPMTDRSMPLLMGLTGHLGEARVLAPDPAAYEALTDKVHLVDLARALGVPVPRSFLAARAEDVVQGGRLAPDFQAFLDDVSLPVILKPGHSVVVGEGAEERFGVREILSEEEFEAAVSAYPAQAYPLMIQQRISGPGLGAFVLSDRGRLVAAFGHRRIREKPPWGGVSVYRESVALREDLREYAAQLLSRVGWSGVAMIEFKEDASTGTPYLMEVNGRFWGSLQLAVDAGVDFPRLLLDEASGAGVRDIAEPRTGIRSRWLLGDLDHLIAVLRAPRDIRMEHPEIPGKVQAIMRFLVPWRPGDRLEVLRLTDPGPFLREAAQWLGAL